jgi:hypothetical protein
MLKEEAVWLGQKLKQHLRPGDTLLHIGSSTLDFRKNFQPWIWENVDLVCQEAGVRVINVDCKNGPGIDVVGDLMDVEFRTRLQLIHAKGLLCANLLEHVTDHRQLARALATVLPAGGLLYFSGPHDFPYHPDPIDNLFRPTIDEAVAEFSLLKQVEIQLIDCGPFSRIAGMRHKFFLLKRLAYVKHRLRSFCYTAGLFFKNRKLFMRLNSARMVAVAGVFIKS